MSGVAQSAPSPPIDAQAFLTALVESGAVTDVDARLAREVARQNGHSAVRALLDLGLISEDDLADRLSRHADLPRWRAEEDEASIVSDAAPREFMLNNGVLLLASPGDDGEADPDAPLSAVCADPTDHHVLRSLQSLLASSVRTMVGTQREIRERLAQSEREQAPADAAADESIDVSAEVSALRDMASEAPVIRFLNQTIERAMDLGASDVHLERFDHRVSLRMRVDGMLVDQPPPPSRHYDALLCRVKIMANLDIAERRRAQDGRIRMRLRGRMVDLRVSLVPTLYGQDAVLRIQDRQRLGEIDLAGLGFGEVEERWLLDSASRSHGIVLITGPTGSGKTTTLYALLRRLVTTDRKIVTVEDPVEYAMDGVNQIQTNANIGLTFGTTLRNVLRHDPDVILIGEIRDQETAQIAFQAALTGHMVLSTLHTNDVPGTFVRLLDMGVEPYLVNAAVVGVTAQRLLRRVCPACGGEPGAVDACKTCGGLGYRGRVAIMERSGLSPGVKRAILDGADERRLAEVLEQDGFEPMRAHAERLVGAGVTNEAEVARVLGQADAMRAVVDDPGHDGG